MSKKNKLSTRKNSHSHILERESFLLSAPLGCKYACGSTSFGSQTSEFLAAGEKADQLKRTAKANRTNKKVTKAQKEGKTVRNKFKGIRIKKGVRIKVCYSIMHNMLCRS